MPTTDSNEELRAKLRALPRTERLDPRYPIDAYEDDLVELIQAAVREARIHENKLHISKFYAASLADGASSLLFYSIEPVFKKRIESITQQKKG